MKKEAKINIFLTLITVILIFNISVSAHEEEENTIELPRSAEFMHTLFDNYGYVSIGFVLLSLVLFFSILKKIMSILTYATIIAIVLVLGYGLLAYHNAGIEKGIVVCRAETDCILAMHIHTELDGVICGEEIKLPLDKGDPTKEAHTHKERNLIHWEAELKADHITKEVLDYSPLKAGAFMDVMGIGFNETCLGDYCNGDKCPDGKQGKAYMYVNDEENNQFANYVWKDKDKIKLVFG